MGTNELILTKTQAGIESTRGTNVAATRILYGQLQPNLQRALTTYTSHTGTYEGRRVPAYSRLKPTFSYTETATFQDLPWWMQLAVKGGVTGVTDGGSPAAYTYDFDPSESTDDIKAVTLEFNETSNDYESAQVMVNTWTLRGDTDNDSEPAWMFTAELLGLDWATTTYTALSERSTEAITARGTKLYIDAAGGTIGTTQKTGSLISWSLSGNNDIHFKAFAENELIYAANKVGRGERTFDAEFTMEFDEDTEFANYRAAAAVQRLIRMEREGPTAIHGTPNTFPRLRVDMYGYWASWTRQDREGNLTMTMSLMAFYDTTATRAFRVEVVNNLITLP